MTRIAQTVEAAEPGAEGPQAAAPAPNAYRELLWTLAIAWICLIGYACTERVLAPFEVPLVKAELIALDGPAPIALAAAFSGRWEPTMTLPARVPAAFAHGGGQPAPRAIDRSPQKILILGDSMVEKLMLRLADYAAENDHQLLPAIWYASTTTGWATSDKLDRLLSEFDPSFVVVVLGSSELNRPHIERIKPSIERIQRRLTGRKFVWIGPPNWREDSGINALYLATLGSGHFFRSADLSFERAKDGIHPTTRSSAAWMDLIAEWIERRSEVPIQLRRPTRKVARPAARVFQPRQ